MSRRIRHQVRENRTHVAVHRRGGAEDDHVAYEEGDPLGDAAEMHLCEVGKFGRVVREQPLGVEEDQTARVLRYHRAQDAQPKGEQPTGRVKCIGHHEQRGTHHRIPEGEDDASRPRLPARRRDNGFDVRGARRARAGRCNCLEVGADFWVHRRRAGVDKPVAKAVAG